VTGEDTEDGEREGDWLDAEIGVDTEASEYIAKMKQKFDSLSMKEKREWKGETGVDREEEEREA
jgi:hypothetical protein